MSLCVFKDTFALIGDGNGDGNGRDGDGERGTGDVWRTDAGRQDAGRTQAGRCYRKTPKNREGDDETAPPPLENKSVSVGGRLACARI
jgi:hypothetical protein